MIDDIYNDLKQSFEHTVRDLGQELSKLRTGRANIKNTTTGATPRHR